MSVGTGWTGEKVRTEVLIKIDDATAINMQHAVRLYVSESVNGYEGSCVTLYNVYTIKKCETREEAIKVLDKILNQYDRGQRVIKL